MAEATKTEGGAAAATEQTGSLIEDILSETKISPKDDAYAVARKGVQACIANLLAPQKSIERVDKSLVDGMIAEIDQRISRQLDEILHAPEFQKLESAWRGLKFVVERTDFRENIKLELLNCSKQDMLTDFEDSPEI